MRPTTTTTPSFYPRLLSPIHHHQAPHLRPPLPPPPWPSSSHASSPLQYPFIGLGSASYSSSLPPSQLQDPVVGRGITDTTPVVVLPKVPVTGDSAFDLVTLSLAICLVLLSLFSVLLVFHLRLKSRSARRLHRFTFHSSARILFVSLVTLWALTELLRLPTSRIRALIPSFPALNTTQQAQMCKVQSVLSLGVFEPGFLVALLFLVNIPISERRRSPSNLIWSMMGCILTVCIPVCAAIYLALYQLPERVSLPEVFVRTAVLFADGNEREVVLCALPLAGAALFGAFGVLYSLVLLLSCWKVISLAMNKWLRSRINALALMILICLAIQVVLSSLSVFWNPEEVTYYVLVLVVFASVVLCAAVGEGILVIIPIGDALSVGVGPVGTGGGEEEEAGEEAPMTMRDYGEDV